MPVIDPNSVEVLREKVDAWREVEQENLSRYCEILDLMLKMADEIDGHPSETVAMIGELKLLVSDMASRIPPERTASDVHGAILPWYLRPWSLVGIGVLIGIIASLATLLLTGQPIFLPF